MLFNITKISLLISSQIETQYLKNVIKCKQTLFVFSDMTVSSLIVQGGKRRLEASFYFSDHRQRYNNPKSV